VSKKSMPQLCDVIGGTRTKIYCQETACRRWVLAALLTVRMGLTEFGNQTTPTEYSEKHDLDTHPTIPLSHLTSCTPATSNLCIANSLAAAISEPALYRLLIFQVPNLMSLFRCFICTKYQYRSEALSVNIS